MSGILGKYMRDLQEKKKSRRLKRFIFSSPVIGLLGIATLFAMQAVWDMALKARDTRDSLEIVIRDFAKLEAREGQIQASILELKTEEGIESRIREKFGYIKEGEEMLMIVDGGGEKSEDEPAPETPGFFQQLFNKEPNETYPRD